MTPAILGMWIKTVNEGIQHHGVITGIWQDPATLQWTLLITHTTLNEGVHIGTLQEFSGSRPIALVSQPITLEHQQMILATAYVNLGQSYAVFGKNCEHFVSHCYSHHAQSHQLQQGVLAVAILASLCVAVVKTSRR